MSKAQLQTHTFTSTDETRYSLHAVQITPDGRAFATDGRVAIMVKRTDGPSDADFPVIPGMPTDEPTTPVYVDRQTAQAALKSIPKSNRHLAPLQNAQLRVNGHVTLATTDLERPTIMQAREHPGDYPNIEAVIPHLSDTGAHVGLCPDLLMTICRYAKAVGADTIRFDVRSPLDGVRFAMQDGDRAHDITGVLMPRRL